MQPYTSMCFSLGFSIYLKKPWTLGLRRASWHFLLRSSEVVFNLLITFRLCSDVEKRPNIQREQRKVRESHCRSYTTSSSVNPPHPAPTPRRMFAAALAGENTTGETGDHSLGPGKNHDEKQSSGRMFCSSANRKTELMFSALVGHSWKCFHLRSCRALAVVTVYFLFCPQKSKELISSNVTL